LVVCAAFCQLLLLWLFALLKECLLALLLLCLVRTPVLAVGDLLEGFAIETLYIYGCASCDDIAGIDTSEGNAIKLEGTGDEENTLVEVFEEDDTLATETSS